MDPRFKPYRTGMVTVKEKYPCGRGQSGSKGRNLVYYLCVCDCGKEFIVSGDELAKHPYSCGCTPKPTNEGKQNNAWALGYVGGTMLSNIKPGRKVRDLCSSGVTGVSYLKRRKKWGATLTLCGKRHCLGEYKTKEEAIKARVEGEKKYFGAYLKNRKQEEK